MRVLDFTRVLAGPWATQILGDQGFDVIKIESPEGDETRGFLPYRDGMSVYFACTNRNKRSVVLDLKTPEGVALARKLAATADVVMENFRPGVMERLGLGDLEKENPALIQVSISAFGPGPLEERAGYDLVLQSMGGIATLTGDPPRKAGPSIADLASAMVAVQAVLFALLERTRTGTGKKVVVRMFDVQHALLAYYASSWLNAGALPPEPSNAHPSISPYNLYPCADGFLAICCANEPLWQRLRSALRLAEDPRFASNPLRVANRDALDRILSHALSHYSVNEAEQILVAAGVPCGPALTVPQSLSHAAARPLAVGPWIFPHPPLDPQQLRPPPLLGEHTEAVLRELGVETEELGRLRGRGVIR